VIRDDVGALEHVRGHEEIARVYAPTLGLECAAHTRGSRERVMNRSHGNLALLKNPEDERKKPRLVSDVPHDAKEGEVLGLAL
jgi:hypothetical protein